MAATQKLTLTKFILVKAENGNDCNCELLPEVRLNIITENLKKILFISDYNYRTYLTVTFKLILSSN